MPAPLLSYYGDDLTGSTDVMEALSLGGVPTVLFLSIPNARSSGALCRLPRNRAGRHQPQRDAGMDGREP